MTENSFSKQQIYDAIAEHAGIDRMVLGVGSKERIDFFFNLAKAVSASVNEDDSKLRIFEKILDSLGITFVHETMTAPPNTITRDGALAILNGLRTSGFKSHELPPIESDESEMGRNRAPSITSIEDYSQFEVDITPDVTSLWLYRNQKFEPQYAIGEFVDNSITSALKNLDLLKSVHGPNYKLKIDIHFDAYDKSLVITDNAAGISAREMNRALKAGVPAEDTTTGLGKYGIGMKAAGFWWGREIAIQTQSIEDERSASVTLDISNRERIDSRVKVKVGEKKSKPGTTIRVSNLWQAIPVGTSVANVSKYLASIYRSYLSQDETYSQGLKCEIRYNGKPLSFEWPPILNAPYWDSEDGPKSGSVSKLWRKEIKFEMNVPDLENGGSKTAEIKGWVGILATMNRDISGLLLKFKGKGVMGAAAGVASDSETDGTTDRARGGSYKPFKIFEQAGGYPYQSYVGEFDMTPFEKTLSTDGLTWTQEQEEEFLQKILDSLMEGDESFHRMVRNYRRKKAGNPKKVEEARLEEAKLSLAAFSGRINHELEASSEFGDIPADLQGATVITQKITDLEAHTHTIDMYFYEGEESDLFLDVRGNAGGLHHMVILNLSHPILNGLRPLAMKEQKLLQRLSHVIAAADIFSSAESRSDFTRRMNQVASMYRPQDDD